MNEQEKIAGDALLSAGNVDDYLKLMQAVEIRVNVDRLALQLKERESRLPKPEPS